MQDARQDDVPDGVWATLAEAASALECSVDTIRRRIRRGELHAVQEAGRHGPTWRVLLSVTPSALHTPSSMPSATSGLGEDSPAFLEALKMLDDLRRENRDLAGQVGYLQARVQFQEQTIKALEAPRTHTAPNLTAQAQDPTTETSEPLRRPEPPPTPEPIPPEPNGGNPQSRAWWPRDGSLWLLLTILLLIILATIALWFVLEAGDVARLAWWRRWWAWALITP